MSGQESDQTARPALETPTPVDREGTEDSVTVERLVQWFCRDTDGREAYLAAEDNEDHARRHQARFAILPPGARCVLIRRTTITEVFNNA